MNNKASGCLYTLKTKHLDDVFVYVKNENNVLNGKNIFMFRRMIVFASCRVFHIARGLQLSKKSYYPEFWV